MTILQPRTTRPDDVLIRKYLAMGAAAVLILALLPGVLAALSAEQPMPDQVMAELQAADAARMQLLEERNEWQMEKERLELLAQTLRRQADELDSRTAQSRERLAELERMRSERQAALQQRDRILKAVDRAAEQIEGELALLEESSPPGLVPPAGADDAAASKPIDRLAGAVRRLDEAAARLQTSSVELVTASLDGRETAVRLLRVGGVAAWWMTLGGDRAGPAATEEAQPVLLTGASEADVRAIRQAFAIAERRAVPRWTVLPLAGRDGP